MAKQSEHTCSASLNDRRKETFASILIDIKEQVNNHTMMKEKQALIPYSRFMYGKVVNEGI